MVDDTSLALLLPLRFQMVLLEFLLRFDTKSLKSTGWKIYDKFRTFLPP